MFKSFQIIVSISDVTFNVLRSGMCFVPYLYCGVHTEKETTISKTGFRLWCQERGLHIIFITTAWTLSSTIHWDVSLCIDHFYLQALYTRYDNNCDENVFLIPEKIVIDIVKCCSNLTVFGWQTFEEMLCYRYICETRSQFIRSFLFWRGYTIVSYHEHVCIFSQIPGLSRFIVILCTIKVSIHVLVICPKRRKNSNISFVYLVWITGHIGIVGNMRKLTPCLPRVPLPRICAGDIQLPACGISQCWTCCIKFLCK